MSLSLHRLWLAAAVSALVSSFPVAASGQMQLVRDINAAGDSNLSNPRLFIAMNGAVYFVATAAEGAELWKTDGTAEGTFQVKDIAAGSSGSNPQWLTVMGGKLYFSADDGASGKELWQSDGTTEGTVMVKDILSGSAGADPRSLCVFNNELYFAADGGTGLELWKSDGTSAGTAKVKEIRVGGAGSVPANLTPAGNFFYFTADNGSAGIELWKSDGTAAGTVMVKDIYTGSSSGFPAELTLMGNMLYFRAITAAAGNELWKSDGTEAGTELVKDIRPGTDFGGVNELTAFNGILYFTSNNGFNGPELWKSDGTTAGTVMVVDLRSGGSFDGGSPEELTVIGSTLFFKATDNTTGRELWKSDGTAEGTVQVKDISPGSATSSSSPSALLAMGGNLYFWADNGTNGRELWRSDGTSAGTVMVKNISASGHAIGETAGTAALFTAGGMLYFAANDGLTGPELWKSNGHEADTSLVKDIAIGTADSSPNRMRALGGTVIFRASDGIVGSELWRSDGTSPGTTLLKDILPGAGSSVITSMTVSGSNVYFTANDGTAGYELWKTNGTAAGTVQVKDIWPGSSGASPSDSVDVNGTLFFTAADGVKGRELWKSNGTAAGTVMVKDIYVGEDDSEPEQLTDVSGVLYFVAETDAAGAELWKSNGTPAGTVMIKDINGDSFDSGVDQLTNVNGTVFFVADDDTAGSELWVSNGTSAGTRLVKDIRTGGTSAGIAGLTNLNGVAIFSANDGTSGQELWRSDGTAAGTMRVKDIVSGIGSSSPSVVQSNDDDPRRGFTVINGIAYFTATSATAGTELWRTDGTEAGTTLLKDINSGSASSSPANLLSVGGALYFDAQAGSARQLWKSDGTAEGTVVVESALGQPRALAVAGAHLYGDARRGDVGLELFMIPDVGPPPVVITTQPMAVTVNPGQTVSFTVAATGKPVLKYQWQVNEEDIPGATAATFKIAPVKEANQGQYRVIVSNDEGSAISEPAMLNVNDPVVIAPQPASVLVAAGTGATLNVGQSGTGPLSWQWFKGNSAIVGATEASFSLDPVSLTDAGSYSVKVTNLIGTVASGPALLVVVNTANVTVGINPSSSLVLNVPALPVTGTGLTWQWKKNGSPLNNGDLGKRVAGATSAKLTITKFTAADEAAFSCVVKLGEVELESGQIQVRVSTKPQLSVKPVETLPTWYVSRAVDTPISDLITLINDEPQNVPTKYAISGLPPGLVVNTATGQITGKATKAGPFKLKITATNPAGSGVAVETGAIQVMALPDLVVGVFSATLARNTSLNSDCGGVARITTTLTGSLSGSLIQAGKTLSFKGVLSAGAGGDATALITVPRSKLTPLQLALTFNASTQQVTGTVTDGTATADVRGWRNPWGTKAPAVPAGSLAGYYTAKLQMTTPQTDVAYPQGHGYALATITSAGVVTWKGQLADGTPITFATTMGPGGQIPLQATLYSNTGSLQGWTQVTAGADADSIVDNALDNLTGDPANHAITWFKANQPGNSKTRSYKTGIPLHNLTITGGGWLKTFPSNESLGIEADAEANALLTFTQGGLLNSAQFPAGQFEQPLRIKAPGYAAVMPPVATNPATVKLTVTGSTGLFKGSFALKDIVPPATKSSSRTANFFGVIVRRLAIGTGHFLLPQLPEAATPTKPATTSASSPILSGHVVLESNGRNQ